jgi:hypothetical protein
MQRVDCRLSLNRGTVHHKAIGVAVGTRERKEVAPREGRKTHKVNRLKEQGPFVWCEIGEQLLTLEMNQTKIDYRLTTKFVKKLSRDVDRLVICLRKVLRWPERPKRKQLHRSCFLFSLQSTPGEKMECAHSQTSLAVAFIGTTRLQR